MEKMRRKKQTNKENYLDYIPKKTQNIEWKQKENGLVQIIMYRNSIIEKIVRKLFFTPDKYKIDLDELGTFVWLNIDGQKTVYEIGQLVKDKFKDDVEPLYERLAQFIQTLANNKFIEF